MAVASTKDLSDLHARLATAMSDALDSEVLRIKATTFLLDNVDEALKDLDPEEAAKIKKILALDSHARVDNGLLKTVSSFLKDNNITSDLGSAEEDDETAKTLKELQAKRRVAATPLDTLQ